MVSAARSSTRAELQRLTCRAGRTRFRRLYLIGACSPVLRIEALRAAVAEARSGNDLKSYEDALQLLRRSSRGSEIEFQADSAWIEKKDKQNKAETTRLEHELKGYKNNLIKESIRVSFPLSPFSPMGFTHPLTLFTDADGQRRPWQPLLQHWRPQ
jgi:hypothetical protein